MADVALIITSSIFGLLIIIGAVYYVVYFQQPDDKMVAWMPKLVVVIGMSLACYNIFLLPLDIANQNNSFIATGGLDMALMEFIFFISSIVVALAVTPFAMYYYEGMDERDDDEGGGIEKQLFYAGKWTFILLFVYFLFVGVLWVTLGWADIPVYNQLGTSVETIDPFALEFSTTQPVLATQEVAVSFISYMIAVASFLGWFMFSVFGGIGLAALPIDLITAFRMRPKRIKLAEYTEKKKLIGQQAKVLIEASNVLRIAKKKSLKEDSKKKQKLTKKQESEFKRDVMFLDSQYQRLEDAYKNGGGNPLVHYFKLFSGLVGCVVSLAWFIHILIYLLPKKISLYALDSNILPTPFLNDFFSNVFQAPVVGITFYGLFAFWLLLCVIKGVTKFGVRFLIIPVHRLKMGDTLMSSLVFNTGVILLSSLAVMQFCTISFDIYAKYTAASAMYGSQIHYFRGIKYVYDAFIWAMPLMTVITMFYLWIKPHDYRKPLI